jgi:signal transduction histidine kinase
MSGVEVELSVADEGPGIAPEDQERIFHEFERADRGMDSEQKGFGLGLALAKHLVELHGGRIWLNSVLGAGSVFFFTLPLFEAPVDEEEMEVPPESLEADTSADEEARRRRLREPGRG